MSTPSRRFLKELCLGIAASPHFHNRFRRFAGRLAILNYHRVKPLEEFIRDESPNRGLAVSVPAFDAQISHIAQRYPTIALDDVPDLFTSDSRDFRVCVTFDDGYRDNLEYALPILKKYGVPATIYVTSRFPEGDGNIWWYELWEILSDSRTIDLMWDGIRRHWDTSTDSLRRRAFTDLRALILSLNRPRQQELMSALRGPRPTADYAAECLTWDEIRELDREPLITIGAHTHTHPNLKNCTPQELQDELTTSKQLLEHHVGHAVSHLAYPFGGPGQTSELVFEAAREFGYATAVTTELGAVDPRRPHALPRLVILEDHNPKRLDIKLSGLPFAIGRPL